MKMRDIIQRYVQKAHSSFRQAPRVTGVIAVVLALLVLSGGAVAQQSGQILIDDFEDGDVDGWGQYAELITEDPIQGDYSMSTSTDPGFSDVAELSIPQDEYSRFSYVMEVERLGSDGYARAHLESGGIEIARLGVSDDYEITYTDGEGTTVGTGVTVPENTPMVYSTTFNWDSDTVQYSVRYWENGTVVYESPTADMWATGYPNSIEYGEVQYESTVDVFTVNGTEDNLGAPDDRNITIQTRDLVFPDGSTHPYDVVLEDTGEVTDESTVTSSNSTLLSVDQANETVTSINDTNASGVVYLNATYQDGTETRTTSKRVVVASPTVSNLEIIPTGLWRTYAVMSDNTIFALIIAGFGAVAAGRFAGAFAGLATAEMVIVIGWLAGYVGLGMAMVSLFMCLFIGLNLAANIDYTVSRARR